MVVHGVAAAVEGARGLVFRRGDGRYIRSQLLQVITGHKFCQLPARAWRARRVVAICERSAPVARRRGMKLRLPTPLHPSATIILVVKTAIRRASQGGGDAVPPRPHPPPRNRAKPRRARLGSAGRARFREKKLNNKLLSLNHLSPCRQQAKVVEIHIIRCDMNLRIRLTSSRKRHIHN